MEGGIHVSPSALLGGKSKWKHLPVSPVLFLHTSLSAIQAPCKQASIHPGALQSHPPCSLFVRKSSPLYAVSNSWSLPASPFSFRPGPLVPDRRSAEALRIPRSGRCGASPCVKMRSPTVGAPAPGPVKGQRWGVEETLALLRLLRASPAVGVFMGSCSAKNEEYWQEVRLQLAEAGHHRTVEQLRARWKRLKTDFFRAGRRAAEGRGKPSNAPPFYEQVRGIWKAAKRPEFFSRHMPETHRQLLMEKARQDSEREEREIEMEEEEEEEEEGPVRTLAVNLSKGARTDTHQEHLMEKRSQDYEREWREFEKEIGKEGVALLWELNVHVGELARRMEDMSNSIQELKETVALMRIRQQNSSVRGIGTN
ncbi:uncharacterized protein LOC133378987 [Rhineura floridana]|uniref:uncharacterized protein LOC133378987 n=1 Tax=Rhineura floridana TaxID=261503 RepID=UPI002AC85D55|nr:uncharacterized protein LOC133378987 [Rhineura floridana]